jgi:hypothetical protein
MVLDYAISDQQRVHETNAAAVPPTEDCKVLSEFKEGSTNYKGIVLLSSDYSKA